MNIDAILKTMLLIGSNLPAYRQLLDQVIAAFSEDDQAKLKASYADALAEAERAHRDAQAL